MKHRYDVQLIVFNVVGNHHDSNNVIHPRDYSS